MSKSKTKPKHTDKAYLKRVFEEKTTTQDRLYNLRNAIDIVLNRIGDYQSDEQLKENFGRMYKAAKQLKTADMKPLPKRTGDYRCDLANLQEWAENPYEKPQDESGPVENVQKLQIDWDESNYEYISASEAIIKFTGSKLSQPALSKLLRQKNPGIRFMNRGHRSKVNIADFHKWAKQQFPPDKVQQEIIDEHFATMYAIKQEKKSGK